MISRDQLYKIIFGTDTNAGRMFDLILLWIIIASVLIVIISSVPFENKGLIKLFYYLEWGFTGIFTIEYILRIYVSPRPAKYIFSFWGIIDFIAFFPTYLSLVLFGFQYLFIIRILRLFRIFRILKLTRFLTESRYMIRALTASFYKISIFIGFMMILVIVLGSVMYVVEKGKNGFTSIPQSIYWAIITITTVGYGDIVPKTIGGKVLSSIVMLIGYAIIAVPTGIVTAEFTKAGRKMKKDKCSACGNQNPPESKFCNECGKLLEHEPF